MGDSSKNSIYRLSNALKALNRNNLFSDVTVKGDKHIDIFKKCSTSNSSYCTERYMRN